MKKGVLVFGVELVAWMLLIAPVALLLTEISAKIGVEATSLVMLFLFAGVFWVIVQVGEFADSLFRDREIV